MVVVQAGAMVVMTMPACVVMAAVMAVVAVTAPVRAVDDTVDIGLDAMGDLGRARRQRRRWRERRQGEGGACGQREAEAEQSGADRHGVSFGGREANGIVVDMKRRQRSGARRRDAARDPSPPINSRQAAAALTSSRR